MKVHAGIYAHIGRYHHLLLWLALSSTWDFFFFLNHSNKPKIINNIKNIQVTDSLKDGGKLQK